MRCFGDLNITVTWCAKDASFRGTWLERKSKNANEGSTFSGLKYLPSVHMEQPCQHNQAAAATAANDFPGPTQNIRPSSPLAHKAGQHTRKGGTTLGEVQVEDWKEALDIALNMVATIPVHGLAAKRVKMVACQWQLQAAQSTRYQTCTV
eukprot:CAMPEP_0117521250 /NCGR_PEP_ID=MMETSP0784-20121206/33590_1 /TAXON_ID=39447 /ORGANISM="" /LENGTH=149 /DNA_ID=CAMNT_0005317275 /DNA_START=450 /DNA_END=901 /DNA_ORIENTATION=+